MSTRSSSSKIRIALATAMLLFVAACGSSSDGNSEPDRGSGTDNGPSTPVEVSGCDDAVTDLDDRSIGREPARCEPDAPQPQPLDDETTIKVGTIAKGEFVAPLLLADQLGEFEKENVKVEIHVLPFPDQMSQLASGNLDVAVGDFGVAWYNAVQQDLDIRAVLGTFFTATAGDLDIDQQGLWVRRDAFSDPDEPDAEELNGKTLASNNPAGSASVVLALESLVDQGLDPSSLRIQQTPSPEQVQALQNDAVQAALLIDPFWTQVEDDEDMLMMATLPPGEPLSGYLFGDRLLHNDQEAGDAFVRAMIRTINTYLASDFHEEGGEVVDELAKALEVDTETLTRFPTPLFDWEIRDGTVTRLQDAFRSFGSYESDENIAEDELVDRSFVDRVLGRG